MKSVVALEESSQALEDISEEAEEELEDIEGLLVWIGRILRGILSN